MVLNEDLADTNDDERRRKNISKTKYFVILVRCWGILTFIVLAGVGIEYAYHRYPIGFYLIGASIFIFAVETSWIATLFLQLLVRIDHPFWRLWSLVIWFDGYKRTIFYIPMATIPALLLPYKLWLSYMGVSMTFVLATLHLLLAVTFKIRRKRRKKRQSDVDSIESNRFDDVTEVLDDSIPAPIPECSRSNSDKLRLEQETFLKIHNK